VAYVPKVMSHYVKYRAVAPAVPVALGG